MLQPEVERYGFTTRFTANIGDDHQFYAQGNFYQTDSFSSSAPRSWTDKAYPRLIYYHEAAKGGHFAAWEQPQIFAEELRAAFKSVR